MKHSIHLGIGQEFSDFFVQVSELVCLNEKKSFLPFYTPLVIFNDVNGVKIIESLELLDSEKPEFERSEELSSVFEKKHYKISSTSNANELINTFFTRLYNKLINVTVVHSVADLKVCFYVPLWRDDLVVEVVNLVNLLAQNENSFSFDIIGFTHDLSDVIEIDSNKNDLINFSIDQLRIKVKDSIGLILNELNSVDFRLNNFILIQNKQLEGISLNLDNSTFVRIISEFILLYIEHYPIVFHNIAKQDNQITGIGFSEIIFDKLYFANYLISRAYISILEKEKVNDTVVDVNLLANQINGVLTKRFGKDIKLFSQFWSDYVEEKVNTGVSFGEILQNVIPKLDGFIDDLSRDLQKFIDGDSLSLPEKRAALASILGEDDELFAGEVYDTNLPIIDDCEFEQANFFVQINNNLSNNEEKELSDFACLQNEADSSGKVLLPLEQIKKLKNTIRNSTQTIRELEKRIAKTIDSSEKDTISEKVLIEGNTFQIGERKFRINEKPIEEQLLEDTYLPKNEYPNQIDLRTNFPNVKNQGEIGACSAFSVVGVFEYIAKSKNISTVFSESFAYYMARSYDSDTYNDNGTSIFNVIKALSVYGVCEKQYWDNSQDFSTEPDIKAKENAQNHKVLRAFNVNHNLHDFKSALSEGYPICFGLRICESFGLPIRGFVTTPSEEEIKKENTGYHSMIICGFSDLTKVFIVRNSWGKEFGDNGYCYIPYSYIENQQFLSQAFIIKEISIGTIYQNSVKTVVNFDVADRMIEYAITRNLVEEEKYDLNNSTKSYEYLRRKYLNINTKLTSIAARNQLVTGQTHYLNKILEHARIERNNLVSRRDKSLSLIQSYTAKVFNWAIISIIGIIFLISLSFYLMDFWKVFKSEYLWYGLGFILLVTLFLPIWKRIQNRNYSRSKQHWDELIQKADSKIIGIQDEIDILRLKSNIAGQLHVKMFALKQTILDKHKIMKSFAGNLQEWYKFEKTISKQMSPDLKFPFINIIDNNVLDDFFNNKTDEIISGIKLSDFINNYELSEAGIIRFKRELRQKIMNRLLFYLDDFNMFKYICGETNYTYLSYQPGTISQQLERMRNMSKVFLTPKAHAVNNETNCLLAINKAENPISIPWSEAIRDVFNTPPTEVRLISANKILMIQVMELDVNDLVIMN